MIEAHRPRLSRAKARRLVAAIALVTLALSLWELRADLPAVLHSDFVQAGQALDFLRTGSVEDRAVYPLPLVYLYAATFLAAYGAGSLLGWPNYADWETFLRHLARPEVHHAIGRSFGALCAALLAVGVYRLARVRFDRSVAVLAAAAAAFSPLQTLYAHQFRPHVPVITVVILLAPAVLRAALAPGLRTGLLSGLAAGVACAVFQAGIPVAAAAVALAVLLVRPARVMASTLLGIGLGVAAGWIGLTLLCTHTGLLAEGTEAGGLLLRGHRGGLGYGSSGLLSQLGHVTLAPPLWLAAETACALGFLGFVWLCLRGRRSWRDLALYGVPAAVIVSAIVFIQLPRVRYTMYATPFLAPLAASAVLAIPAAPARLLGARRLAAGA
ncbi:MAG TPA: glycosyltransferase family 39 protein, partial [Planctomycetota bacterium]|nr:glycosyltransferase family 39 protein [Planctomycetota bacterium]